MLNLYHLCLDLDMSAWESLGVPSPVLKALQDMSFTKPTPIQSECIPAAIRKRQDIMGAAETVSQTGPINTGPINMII